MTETRIEMNEDPTVCYFCKGTPSHIKRDVTLEEAETPDGQALPDVEVIELLAVCEPCNVENYDDTEAYPGLLPLDTRP